MNVFLLLFAFLPLPPDSTYFPGRCAEVHVRGNLIGHLGVLHPDVITSFDLNLPAAAMEIGIEYFLWGRFPTLLTLIKITIFSIVFSFQLCIIVIEKLEQTYSVTAKSNIMIFIQLRIVSKK